MAKTYSCPIDKTSLVNLGDHYNSRFYICNTCGQHYANEEMNRLKQVGQERVSEARDEVERMENLKPKLEKLIKLYEESHNKKR